MMMIQSQLELQELQNIKTYPFSAQRFFVAAVRATKQTVRFSEPYYDNGLARVKEDAIKECANVG